MTTFIVNGRQRTPAGIRVEPMSYAKLEQAADVLRPTLPKVASQPYKVDCIRVLERSLKSAGINMHVAPRSELKDCAAFTAPTKNVVVMREDIYDDLHDDGVYGRSTVIHELSHIVLRHAEAATLRRSFAAKKHEFFEDSEWQAKALAPALLMPREACQVARTIEELAERCGTSVQSATFRMQMLTQRNFIRATPQMLAWLETQERQNPSERGSPRGLTMKR